MKNNPIITFRNKGAVGALFDEYEKAVRELQDTVETGKFSVQ